MTAQTDSRRRIGAHLSIAGSPLNALKKSQEMDANALQIFSGSPRVWARSAINPVVWQEFKQQAAEQDISPIFVHALYLVNFSSENTELVQKSKNAIVHDLKFGTYFNCAGVVIHLGSHQGRGWDIGRDRLAVLIQECIDEAGSDVPFLIENSAGQKGKLCSELSEIRWLLDTVNRPQLGWCYDTCHGWAAGYRAVPETDTPDNRKLFEQLDSLQLWDSLKCMHVNDSRDPGGSGRDRHDNIGDGTIAPGELTAILNHPKALKIPLITEAPGLDGNGPDAENIRRLRALVGEQ